MNQGTITGHLVWDYILTVGAATRYWVLHCFACWCLENTTFLWYYHCNYLVITDRNFSSVMPSGWSAVGLVPEWELIIRSDEETHVPVMSEPARLQVMSRWARFSTSQPPQQYRKQPQLIFVHGWSHVAPIFPTVLSCSGQIPPKDAGNEAFCLLAGAQMVRFFPLGDWWKRCNQEINSMPSTLNARIVFSRTPTAVGWSKVFKGKRKYCFLWICFAREKILVGSAMIQAEFYIGTFAPPPSSHDSDIVPQTSAAGWSGHDANLPEGMTEGANYNVQWETTTKTVLLLTNTHNARFMWRITNTEILLGWENKRFLSLFSASFSLSGWGVWMSEWVTGQPDERLLSQILYPLSLLLIIYSQIFWVSLAPCWKVWGFGECAVVQSCSFWAADVLECCGAAWWRSMDRRWSTRRLGQREIGFSDGHCIGDLPGQSGEGKPEENLVFKCSAIPQESRENTISAWTLNHPFSRSFTIVGIQPWTF